MRLTNEDIVNLLQCIEWSYNPDSEDNTKMLNSLGLKLSKELDRRGYRNLISSSYINRKDEIEEVIKDE